MVTPLKTLGGIRRWAGESACQPFFLFSVFITFGGPQAHGHSVGDAGFHPWRTLLSVPRSHSCERLFLANFVFAGVRTRHARVRTPQYVIICFVPLL